MLMAVGVLDKAGVSIGKHSGNSHEDDLVTDVVTGDDVTEAGR